MKKTVVGMLALSAMAVAMGSAFAQETAKVAPEMTAAEKDQAKKIYFERCAGCHGVSLGTKRLPFSICSTTGWRPSVMVSSSLSSTTGRQ